MATADQYGQSAWMVWRWIRRFLTIEGLNALVEAAGLGNPVAWLVKISLTGAALAMGWFVAAQAWAEGVLEPYGTLGYVVVVLAIAILLLLVVGIAARCYILLCSSIEHAKRARAGIQDDINTDVNEPAFDRHEDEQSYNRMLDFFIDHLMPTAKAQLDFQKAVLRLAITGDKAFELASRGLEESFFYDSVRTVSAHLSGSPSIKPSFEELETSIYFAEMNYGEFRDQANSLARDAGVNIEDGDLFELWNVWSYKHDALVRAYEPLKRDRNLGKLFRPMRPSRWGEPINRKPAGL